MVGKNSILIIFLPTDFKIKFEVFFMNEFNVYLSSEEIDNLCFALSLANLHLRQFDNGFALLLEQLDDLRFKLRGV